MRDTGTYIKSTPSQLYIYDDIEWRKSRAQERTPRVEVERKRDIVTLCLPFVPLVSLTLVISLFFKSQQHDCALTLTKYTTNSCFAIKLYRNKK